MATVSIKDARPEGVDGVRFTAALESASSEFVVSREALEDVAYEMLENPDALLQAFHRHEAQVAEAAARAFGSGAAAAPVMLQSLL